MMTIEIVIKQEIKQRTANGTYPKGGVWCSADLEVLRHGA